MSATRPRPDSDLDLGISSTETATLNCLRVNLISNLNKPRLADFHGDYRHQLHQIDAELSRRARRTEMAVTVAQSLLLLVCVAGIRFIQVLA